MRQPILKRQEINLEFKKLFDYPLTVAVAAMGYGKTTSARDCLNDLKANYIWMSCESDESSPEYIWDSLTRQLSKTNPEFGNQLRRLGFPDDAMQRDKVLKIIEDHTYMTNTVLVIDDYHFVHSSELNSLVERIVRAKIEGLHILILSRTKPDISMDELMLKGYCYQIKSNLFEVSNDEIKEYFQLYGVEISEDMAEDVYNISEGWVSAVYLIRQRYAEIGRLEPGKSIEGLIETAVMSRYSEREVMVLKSLCVLDSFTPMQALYVTEDMATERIIRKLSYENSFIRYDERNDVYRIHNIFKSYLQTLVNQHSPDMKLKDMLTRSGEWCLENGDILSGLKYLLQAKEYNLILAEFEKTRITQVIDSNPKYILELFRRIPLEVNYRHPIGYITYVGFYVTNVDREKGAGLLSEIEEYYKKDDRLSPEMKGRITGEIELIRAYIHFNNIFLMKGKLTSSYQLLKGRSSIANKDKIVTFGSPHILYMYYHDIGKMLWTVEYLEDIFPYYLELSGGCGRGFEYQLRSEFCLETGDLHSAKIYAKKAIYKARSLEQLSIVICSNLTLARVYAAEGKFNEALEIMDELSAEVEVCSCSILKSAFDLSTSYIAGITRKKTAFTRWLRSGDIEQSHILYQGVGFNYIVYGKFLLLEKNYIKLEILCEEMLRVFSKFNNLLGYLHTYILYTVANQTLYGASKAKTTLLLALDIGRQDRIVLPFAEYGMEILEILQTMQNDIRNDEYLDRIVAYTSQYCIKLNSLNHSLGPLLTNREKEILELMIKGKTNREIASELFIAEVTVRKNITAVYRKLEVTGRASAVRKAIELKII
ncbi:ATP-dependent transcriptional regulator [Desulfosporosinus orientis DSM 765]|uniref:ATP-dependent transcriptional regulator n=1 Tax=Desulfosporosinus orientis (strain ATCC 19365 / DSM 765 / NCIMB 8382 / VKM B-1628 / Singapore I) TaxID=768706 RepID=G7W581_DESOD|nr:LuxR C-terminal-related transcriptional regulator [Desulfosporosinus orientis]AET66097.1 ATP-dependent transcriptional regulator [Desulfosporosinus orientis DSM 765]